MRYIFLNMLKVIESGLWITKWVTLLLENCYGFKSFVTWKLLMITYLNNGFIFVYEGNLSSLKLQSYVDTRSRFLTSYYICQKYQPFGTYIVTCIIAYYALKRKD